MHLAIQPNRLTHSPAKGPTVPPSHCPSHADPSDVPVTRRLAPSRYPHPSPCVSLSLSSPAGIEGGKKKRGGERGKREREKDRKKGRGGKVPVCTEEALPRAAGAGASGGSAGTAPAPPIPTDGAGALPVRARFPPTPGAGAGAPSATICRTDSWLGGTIITGAAGRDVASVAGPGTYFASPRGRTPAAAAAAALRRFAAF